jgi:hypothetical protein
MLLLIIYTLINYRKTTFALGAKSGFLKKNGARFKQFKVGKGFFEVR